MLDLSLMSFAWLSLVVLDLSHVIWLSRVVLDLSVVLDCLSYHHSAAPVVLHFVIPWLLPVALDFLLLSLLGFHH